MKKSALVACLVVASSAPAHAQRDTIVVNATAPVHRGGGTLVEVTSLGGGAVGQEYEFSHAFVYRGLRGSIFVLDLADPNNVGAFRSTVRQYDSTGRYIRTFGRVGDGPGEFRGAVGSVAQLPDGRVLVSHFLGLNVYGPDARPVASWPARDTTSRNVGGYIHLHQAGDVFVEPWPSMRTVGDVFRFKPNGDYLGVVRNPRLELAALGDPCRMRATRVPFCPRYHVAWSPAGYFITGHSSRYAIDLRRPPSGQSRLWRDGDPITSIRRSVAPIPVAAAERDDWSANVTMFSQSPVSGGDSRWSWDGPDIPKTKPFFRDLFVDNRGRIWVLLSQPAVVNPEVKIPTRPAERGQGYDNNLARKRWVEPWAFDVFEPDGRYLGEVRFPIGTGHPDGWPAPAFQVDGDIVWAVTYDAEAVPSVKKYRIQWRD